MINFFTALSGAFGTGPLLAILMPLLGTVAALGIARSGKLFIRAVIGMGVGFTCFAIDNFAPAMVTGEHGGGVRRPV